MPNKTTMSTDTVQATENRSTLDKNPMQRTTLDITSMESTLGRAVSSHYGDRLVSLAVFGSIARRVHTPESDVDVLIISDDLPDGRLARVREFAFAEEVIEQEMGRELMLSPVLKTPNEASHGSPLLWDMVDYSDILYDRDDFLAKLLNRTKERLTELGARRVQRGNAWYWILKEKYTPGEVFEI